MTVTVRYVSGQIYKIDPTGGWFSVVQATGAALEGSTVTAYFDDDTSETATFVDSGGDRGDAVGTGWYVYVDGKTGRGWNYIEFPGNPEYWPLGGQPWHFVFDGVAAGLVKLEFNLFPSTQHAVFDVDVDAIDGTPGSAAGGTFTPYEGIAVDVTVTYKNRVDYLANETYRDLWLYQRIEFASALTTDFSWFQDHDLLENPLQRNEGDTIFWALAESAFGSLGGPYTGELRALNPSTLTWRDDIHLALGDGEVYWDLLTIGEAGSGKIVAVFEGEPHNAFLYDISDWTRGDALELTGAYELNRQSAYDSTADAWYFNNYDYVSATEALVIYKVDVGGWTQENFRLDNYGEWNFYPQGDGIAVDPVSGYGITTGYNDSAPPPHGQLLIRFTLDPFEYVDEFPLNDYFSSDPNFLEAAAYSIVLYGGYFYVAGGVRYHYVDGGSITQDYWVPMVGKFDPSDMSLVASYIDTDTVTDETGEILNIGEVIDLVFDDDGSVYACGFAQTNAPDYIPYAYKLVADDLSFVSRIELPDLAAWVGGPIIHGGKLYLAEQGTGLRESPSGPYRNFRVSVVDLDTFAVDGTYLEAPNSKYSDGRTWGMICPFDGDYAQLIAAVRRLVIANINMRRR